MAQSKRAAAPLVNLDDQRARSAKRARTLVAAPPDGPLVKQRDLQEVLARRRDVEALSMRLAEAKKLAEEAELPVKLAFSVAGAHVEPGPLVAAVSVTSRRNPSWKDAFVARCGKDAARLVIANTKPTTYRTLVITETTKPVAS